MTNVTFITGNPNKAAHFSKQIGLEVAHIKLDLYEIQSKSPEEVIEHKVRQAYEELQSPVIVDDFSFWFDEYDGLPGPFIKFFVEAEDGLEKLCRIADTLVSRRGTQRGYIGYYDGQEVKIFHGELKGEIVDHPRIGDGSAGAFGADPIFAPDGYDGRTRSQLTSEEYQDAYRQVRAINEVREFLRNRV